MAPATLLEDVSWTVTQPPRGRGNALRLLGDVTRHLSHLSHAMRGPDASSSVRAASSEGAAPALLAAAGSEDASTRIGSMMPDLYQGTSEGETADGARGRRWGDDASVDLAAGEDGGGGGMVALDLDEELIKVQG